MPEPTPLKVPARFREAFASFVGLSTDHREAFVEALAAAPVAFVPEDVAAGICEETGQDLEAATYIVQMILSMYRSGMMEAFPPAELAQDLCKAATEDPEITVPEGDEKLQEHLERVLSLEESLGITSKAYGVLRERERSVCSTRVVTDIRPVFGQDAATPPAAAFVTHTLRIAYHVEDGIKEFYVSLKHDDVEALVSDLNRALEKETTLSGLLEEKGIRCLPTRGH